MSKLKAIQITKAPAPCKLSDGKGLYFEITKSGSKRWIYRFKIAGKESTYTIGHFPELSLAKAREAHLVAYSLVKEGLNPSSARKKEKQRNIDNAELANFTWENSFEVVALEWIEQQRDRWSSGHTERVSQTIRNNVICEIGHKSVDSITPPEILLILRKIEKRGSLEIARKVLQRVSAIFRYAIQTGRATYNPAADMQGVLKTRTVTHMPALYDTSLATLLRDIQANETLHLTTKLALQFAALTACRSGEVRNASWSEIDHKKAEWHIPAERMKMRRPHIVPLSKQTLAVLNRAGMMWGKEGLIFPSVRDKKKPMSDNAMSKALRDMGYRGKATPHGFRSSFSSMAHEASDFASEVIEKSLAHEEKNKIKGAYNRAEYLEQRRGLMRWWGNVIEELTLSR